MGQLRVNDTKGVVQDFEVEVPASNVTGGLLITHRIEAAAAANGDHTVILEHKERVIDAYAVLQGSQVSSAVLTVSNAGDAITDDMDISGTDKALTRCTTIDDAYCEISAGGTLQVTTSGGSTAPAFICHILCMRVV